MTITVFVWMPIASVNREQRSVGHASLHLATKKVYISFWPEEGSYGPAVGHNMGADRAGESGRLPDYASAPITLDEDAVLAYWKKVKVGSRTVPYHGGASNMASRADADTYEIFGKNCSKIVLDCLIAGGALNNNRIRTLYDDAATITPLDIRQIAEILAGERGSVGGANFPIADSLMDKARNAGTNFLVYREYVKKAVLGAAIDSVKKPR